MVCITFVPAPQEEGMLISRWDAVLRQKVLSAGAQSAS